MKRLIGLLALTALLAVVSPTMAQDLEDGIACERDLTGETITFYHFGDLSGPYTFLTAPVLAGFQDALDYFNANGGLCGAEIAQEYADTGASQEAAQAIFDDFSNRDDVHVIFLYNTEDAELLRQQAAEAQIPLMISTGSVLGLYGEDADAPGWVFSVTPLYEDQMGAFCDHIAANWDDYGIDGDPVIGHVSWLGAFGESSDTDETRAYCQSLGIGYAGARYYFPGIPDISSLVQPLVADGATILYTTSVSDGPARLASTAATLDLGVNENVMIAGPNWVLDSAVVRLAGRDAEGFLGQMPYLWWDELSHPGIQVVTTYWAQNRAAQGDLDDRGIAYLLAWAAVDTYRSAVIDTVNREGLDGLSGPAIYDSLTSGTTYTGLEGVFSVSYDEQRRAPNQTRFGVIRFPEDSSLPPFVEIVEDWVTIPDLRPGGADVVE